MGLLVNFQDELRGDARGSGLFTKGEDAAMNSGRDRQAAIVAKPLGEHGQQGKAPLACGFGSSVGPIVGQVASQTCCPADGLGGRWGGHAIGGLINQRNQPTLKLFLPERGMVDQEQRVGSREPVEMACSLEHAATLDGGGDRVEIGKRHRHGFRVGVVGPHHGDGRTHVGSEQAEGCRGERWADEALGILLSSGGGGLPPRQQQRGLADRAGDISDAAFMGIAVGLDGDAAFQDQRSSKYPFTWHEHNHTCTAGREAGVDDRRSFHHMPVERHHLLGLHLHKAAAVRGLNRLHMRMAFGVDQRRTLR